MDRNTSIVSNGPLRSDEFMAEEQSAMDDLLGVTRPGLSRNGAAVKPYGSIAQLRLHQTGGVIAPTDFATLIRQRRRRKFVRFVVIETAAIVLLIGSLIAGLSAPFAAESLTPLFRVVPIAAATVATVLPILFFGNSRGD